MLTLYRGSTIIAANDDWDVSTTLSAQTSAGAAPLTKGSRDAVITAVLPAGSYTAQVSARDDSTGIALVEIFELP